MTEAIVAIVIVAFIVLVISRTIKVIPQARARTVERLGRYQRTLTPGLSLVIPFIDRVSPLIDMREQVVSFPPQPVITEDNLVVEIDTVIYVQVTDPKAATYEIADYMSGIEQITVTTLRNQIGSMDLEQVLTSRDKINASLRLVLDEVSTNWGIRVSRVELKSIDPPSSVQESMEKQMRAERDKRAAILNSEGQKQSAILIAQGDSEAKILAAKADAESEKIRAEAQAEALKRVFDALGDSNIDDAALAYHLINRLPSITDGQSNTVLMLPAEISKLLEGFSGRRDHA